MVWHAAECGCAVCVAARKGEPVDAKYRFEGWVTKQGERVPYGRVSYEPKQETP
jgi:hypothetical protein